MQIDLRRDDLSVWFVCTVVVLALVAGWLVKLQTQNQVKLVRDEGVTLAVPVKWIVRTEGVGDNVLVASSIDNPDLKCQVALLAAGSDLTLPTAASQRNLLRARTLSSYRVLDQEAIILGGRNLYQVHYAYVKVEPRKIPVVLEGVEYLFFDGGRIVAVAYEDRTASFGDSRAQFERLVTTVRYAPPVAGGASQ